MFENAACCLLFSCFVVNMFKHLFVQIKIKTRDVLWLGWLERTFLVNKTSVDVCPSTFIRTWNPGAQWTAVNVSPSCLAPSVMSVLSKTRLLTQAQTPKWKKCSSFPTVIPNPLDYLAEFCAVSPEAPDRLWSLVHLGARSCVPSATVEFSSRALKNKQT